MYGDLFEHFPYVVIDGYFGCDALALGSVPCYSRAAQKLGVPGFLRPVPDPIVLRVYAV